MFLLFGIKLFHVNSFLYVKKCTNLYTDKNSYKIDRYLVILYISRFAEVLPGFNRYNIILKYARQTQFYSTRQDTRTQMSLPSVTYVHHWQHILLWQPSIGVLCTAVPAHVYAGDNVMVVIDGEEYACRILDIQY